jgi:hypothetical protein
MKWLLALAFTVAATPAAAQASAPDHAAPGTEPTASQRRLIGCFGEAFTLVEHVWRIAPAHLDALSERATQTPDAASREYLAGMVAGALDGDQRSAEAIARNLDGCMTEALTRTNADATTAVLATAVRTELDSALDDVKDLIVRETERRPRLRQAIGSQPTDRTLDSPLDVYLGFGERMQGELQRLRTRADALVQASTPTQTR